MADATPGLPSDVAASSLQGAPPPQHDPAVGSTAGSTAPAGGALTTSASSDDAKSMEEQKRTAELSAWAFAANAEPPDCLQDGLCPVNTVDCAMGELMLSAKEFASLSKALPAWRQTEHCYELRGHGVRLQPVEQLASQQLTDRWPRPKKRAKAQPVPPSSWELSLAGLQGNWTHSVAGIGHVEVKDKEVRFSSNAAAPPYSLDASNPDGLIRLDISGSGIWIANKAKSSLASGIWWEKLDQQGGLEDSQQVRWYRQDVPRRRCGTMVKKFSRITGSPPGAASATGSDDEGTRPTAKRRGATAAKRKPQRGASAPLQNGEDVSLKRKANELHNERPVRNRAPQRPFTPTQSPPEHLPPKKPRGRPSAASASNHTNGEEQNSAVFRAQQKRMLEMEAQIRDLKKKAKEDVRDGSSNQRPQGKGAARTSGTTSRNAAASNAAKATNPVPQPAPAAEPPVAELEPLSSTDRDALQGLLDALSEEQVEKVLDLVESWSLTKDVLADNGDDSEMQLELDSMPPHRQAELAAFVESLHRKGDAAGTAAHLPAPGAQAPNSRSPAPQETPIFAVQSPARSYVYAAPPAAAAVEAAPQAQAAIPPRASPSSLTPMKRVWEEFAAREVQRRQHREIADDTEDGAEAAAAAANAGTSGVEAKRAPSASATRSSADATNGALPGEADGSAGDSMFGAADEILSLADCGWA